MDTLSYWLARLEPIIRNEGEEEIIAIFANRTGTEDNAVYAGTSAILGIQAGEVKVYGILGRGERELLVIDTSERPKMQLVSEPRISTPLAKAATLSQDKTSASFSRAAVNPTLDEVADSERLSTSSDSAAGDQSLTGILSISTGRTSLDPPPLDPCSFSPVSPVDKQAYFPNKSGTDLPVVEQKRMKERLPTPIPAEPDTRPSVRRYPTPVSVPSVHSRPASPKSRNCSRSRGAVSTLQDSPPLIGTMSLLGNILSDEERLKDSPILRSISMLGQGIDLDLTDDDLDPNEIIYIEAPDSPPFEILVDTILNNNPRISRADFMANHINNQPMHLPSDPAVAKIHPDCKTTETVLVDSARSRTRDDSDKNNTPELSPASAADSSPSANSHCDCDHSPPTQPASADPPQRRNRAETGRDDKDQWLFNPINLSQLESSFTRNPLGPRSLHITPRPLSTMW
ncbi:Carbon-nitrogen hydrolase [Cadophora gregata f. sp. sojae]|nr:Carbon-nitrogen hydrolase [Cadophora gregata f. sp. sojae]